MRDGEHNVAAQSRGISYPCWEPATFPFMKILKQIFRLLDSDQDGYLSDLNVNDFQLKVFLQELERSEMELIRQSIIQRFPSVISKTKGISFDGFLWLVFSLIGDEPMAIETILNAYDYLPDGRFKNYYYFHELNNKFKATSQGYYILSYDALKFLTHLFIAKSHTPSSTKPVPCLTKESIDSIFDSTEGIYFLGGYEAKCYSADSSELSQSDPVHSILMSIFSNTSIGPDLSSNQSFSSAPITSTTSPFPIDNCVYFEEWINFWKGCAYYYPDRVCYVFRQLGCVLEPEKMIENTNKKKTFFCSFLSSSLSTCNKLKFLRQILKRPTCNKNTYVQFPHPMNEKSSKCLKLVICVCLLSLHSSYVTKSKPLFHPLLSSNKNDRQQYLGPSKSVIHSILQSNSESNKSFSTNSFEFYYESREMCTILERFLSGNPCYDPYQGLDMELLTPSTPWSEEQKPVLLALEDSNCNDFKLRKLREETEYISDDCLILQEEHSVTEATIIRNDIICILHDINSPFAYDETSKILKKLKKFQSFYQIPYSRFPEIIVIPYSNSIPSMDCMHVLPYTLFSPGLFGVKIAPLFCPNSTWSENFYREIMFLFSSCCENR